MTIVSDHSRIIADRIMTAKIHFDIFDTLSQHRSKQESLNALEPYWTFFLYSIKANFDAAIVEIYSLYETRSDTINFPRLIQDMKTLGQLKPPESCIVEKKLSSIKKAWIKVSILRNEVVGHKTKNKTPAEVYKNAAVTPLQIEQIILESMELYNSLGLDKDAFNIGVTKSIDGLVKTLSKNEK
jgi:hypothetical protein